MDIKNTIIKTKEIKPQDYSYHIIVLATIRSSFDTGLTNNGNRFQIEKEINKIEDEHYTKITKNNNQWCIKCDGFFNKRK